MKRILLKLSGEALAGAKKTGFDEETVIAVSRQIRTIAEEGTQVGIVIGGGNFWRGRTSETINRNKADQIGMLATVMNCIYVSDICRYLGLDVYKRQAVNTALHQDKVQVLLKKEQKPGKRREGTVIKILERGTTEVVGTFQREGDYGFVLCDNQKISRDVYISPKNSHGIRDGEKVVAQIQMCIRDRSIAVW